MASLVLGVAGAGIGSMFGYASIGWSIGSFIGGQLFGPDGQDIKGPRLSDKSITTSAYGNMRPVIYGGYRVGGEIIWSTDLKEHAHKEEAGKGGGGGGSYTTYTYTVSFAVALCKGPIIGVRKIWFAGNLVYSVADDATNAELQASEKLAKRIKFYTGTDTQTADPTIEADKGAGNVPGYRGTAYIVFTDLDVTKFGTIPQITVEVIQSGAFNLVGSQIASNSESARQSLSLEKGVARAFYWEYSSSGGQTDGVFQQRGYSLVDGSLTFRRRLKAGPHGDESNGWRYLYEISMSPNGKFVVAEGGDIGTGNNKFYHLLGDAGGLAFDIDILPTITDLDNYENGTDRSYNLIWEDDYNLWFYKFNSGDVYHFEIIVTLLGTFYVNTTRFNVDDTRDGTDGNGGLGSFCIERGTGEIYVEIATLDATPVYSIKRFSRDGTLIETKFTGTDWRSYQGRLMAFSEGILYEVSGVSLHVYDWDSEILLSSIQLANSSFDVTGAIMETSGNLVSILADGVLYNYSRRLSSIGIGLDEAVSDICTTVGLESSEIDVTDLAADTLRGFMIANQGPARGALEQLSAAFFFDGRESDGVLEFVKRGASPTVTLDDDDLGCYEGDDVQELADASRTQEEELPKALTLNYANVGADYQVGAQHSLRQSVLNGTEATVQLPIVLSDTEAKKIVDTMMFAAWQNRHQFTLKTWQSFQKLDAADMISARGETLRITNRAEGMNGIIELIAVRELPENYTGQVGSGATSGHTGQTVTIGGPTLFSLLDIPPLRDADYNNYGMYWAATGYLDDWPGAALLRSPDGGATWDYEFSQDQEAVIGQTDGALGDFTGGNIFDEKNVLRVNVRGTLESKTELQVLNGGNVAMVGNELIQFRTATLVSTGIYDLTGLLRGRMGTEWAINEHTAYEDFTLLNSTTTRFIDVPISDLNSLRSWGCVTFGDTVEDIVSRNITYTGNNLRPLPPVQVVGGVTGYSTDWIINWKRRTRFNWQWLDAIDVGADETSYDFQVAILDGANTVRTITVTGAQTTTYTIAQQIADFGLWQQTLDIKIRQVGATRNSEWTDVITLESGFTGQTVLLTHCDGADGSTTFTDQYSHTITANGNAQIDTGIAEPFGTSNGVLLCDGTVDYLSIPSSTDFDFEQDFTLECFARFNSVGATQGLISRRPTTSDYGPFVLRLDSTGKIGFLSSQSGSSWAVDILTTDTYTTATWYHVAITRQNNLYTVWVNGAVGISTTVAGTPMTGASSIVLGAGASDGGFSLNGWMDEIRLSRGALYTSPFTPPTSPFTE